MKKINSWKTKLWESKNFNLNWKVKRFNKRKQGKLWRSRLSLTKGFHIANSYNKFDWTRRNFKKRNPKRICSIKNQKIIEEKMSRRVKNWSDHWISVLMYNFSNSALRFHKYSLARDSIVCSAGETHAKKFMNHIVIKLPSINKFSDHECHTISHQKVCCRI